MNFEDLAAKGTYEYYHKNQMYSQEIFEIYKNRSPDEYLYKSELLTRVKTGGFLKLIIKHELNARFESKFISIEKTLGEQSTKEIYLIDPQTKSLNYSFSSDEGEQSDSKNVGHHFYVSTPSFLSSALIILSKKLNSVGRTSYSVMTAANDWSYESGIVEKNIFIESIHKDEETKPMTISGTEYTNSLYYFYEFDTVKNVDENPIKIWVGNHFGIPLRGSLSADLQIKLSKFKLCGSNVKI